MTDVGALLLLAAIVLVGGISYLYLYKARRLISYHLGMNIAMTASGVSGLAIGAVLSTWLSHDMSTLVIIGTTCTAIVIGIVFGSLVDYQTIVSGVTSGVMSGLMGPMLGMHLSDPGIIAVFCSILACMSFFMLCLSVRA